jgi:uncharacterized protein (TIGR02246 family)
MKTAMLTVVLLTCGWVASIAADNEQTTDETLIREAVESYVAAYNRADAKALAAHWSPEGVYQDPITGEQVVGREAIEQQFAAIFAESQNARLTASTNAIQFVSPNVAIEHGEAQVIRGDQTPEESAYSAVYVKRDGQWLLDRVTEEETAPAVSAPYEQLKVLEWMIGTWIDQDEESRIETTCEWTKNQSFITRSFTLTVGDQIEMAGMQVIGWDPAAKQIRSWVFDSDGGFGEGTWSQQGNAWNIQQVGTLTDGRKSSSVNIITYVDENTFTWQSVNRIVDGELLPNVDEVVVVRDATDSVVK